MFYFISLFWLQGPVGVAGLKGGRGTQGAPVRSHFKPAQQYVIILLPPTPTLKVL